MGKRKSNKRRSEFEEEKEMHRLMKRYHDEVIVDLIHSDVPHTTGTAMWTIRSCKLPILR
jgi:hypothetical protein